MYLFAEVKEKLKKDTRCNGNHLPMEELPNNLIREILLKQDINTIKEFCQTCSKIQSISDDDYFWQQLVSAHFWLNTLARDMQGASWWNTYKTINLDYSIYKKAEMRSKIISNYLSILKNQAMIEVKRDKSPVSDDMALCQYDCKF